MTKRKTNMQLVTSLMDSGNPMDQAFIIEAISRYANQVSEDSGESWPEKSFIAFEAWQDSATRIAATIENHFKN